MLLFLRVAFVCVVGISCDLALDSDLLPTDCGVSNEDYTVTSVPSLDEFPWMAIIAHSVGNTTKYNCTGTIIGAQNVLTSAQCVTNVAYVRVGEYDVSTELDCIGDDTAGLDCLNNTQDFEIEDEIVHENFTMSGDFIENDIALLRLKKKIDFSFDNIGPICLPSSYEQLDVKSRGRIVVWGLNKSNTTAMRKYNVWLTPVDECYSKWKRSKPTLANEYCVRKGSYIADIGGPLLFKKNGRYSQHGVATKETAEYVFYTDITKYKDWILENIRI